MLEFVDKAKLQEQSRSAYSINNDLTVEKLRAYFGKGDKNIKKAVRNLILHDQHRLRPELWHLLCNKLGDDQGNLYRELLTEVNSAGNGSLPVFVDEDKMNSYFLNHEGQMAVNRVLQVLCRARPDISWAPELYSIVALFLHYMDEEHAFQHAYNLSSSHLKHICQSKLDCSVKPHILKDLLKKYKKPVYKSMMKKSGNCEAILQDWTWWIYSYLPFHHLLNIIDCFLLEGSKVFYRVCLALLSIYHQSAGKNDENTWNQASQIQNFCKNFNLPIEDLLASCFAITGLSRSEIVKLKLKHVMRLKSEHISTSRSQSLCIPSHSVKVGRRLSLQQGPLAFVASPSPHVLMKEWESVFSWLPYRFSVYSPVLIFTTAEHGSSLRTFYSRTENYEPTLLFIITTTGELFGAFCSEAWLQRSSNSKNLSYFGTGETFLFSLRPRVKCFPWVGIKLGSETPHASSLFMAGDISKVTIGGGNGEAIAINEDMLSGYSTACDTFANEPFVANKYFEISELQVYIFSD